MEKEKTVKDEGQGKKIYESCGRELVLDGLKKAEIQVKMSKQIRCLTNELDRALRGGEEYVGRW